MKEIHERVEFAVVETILLMRESWHNKSMSFISGLLKNEGKTGGRKG